MVNVKRAAEAVGRLAILRFFPSDPNAQAAIVQILCEMARSNEQIDWLVNRMIAIYNEWPGPREMRACFCCRFRPKDGQNACSEVYLDGSWPVDPTAPPRPELMAPAGQKRIAGETISEDPQLQRAISTLARAKSMDRATRRKPAPPNPPGFKPLTQADIDAAVQQNRDKRAREEAGL